MLLNKTVFGLFERLLGHTSDNLPKWPAVKPTFFAPSFKKANAIHHIIKLMWLLN